MALVIGICVKFLFLIFCVKNILSQTAEYHECADPQCSKPIAKGETTQSYSTIKANGLSFPGNAKVDIFSKGGEDIVIELSGKRGYVPSRLIKETSVIVTNLINVTKEDISANLFQNSTPPVGTQVPVPSEGSAPVQQPEGHQHGQAATQGSQQGLGQAEQGTQQLVQPEGHQHEQAASQGSQQGLGQAEQGTQQLVQPEGHQHEQAASQGSQQEIEQVAEQGTQQLVQPEGHQHEQAATQGSQQGIGQVAEQGTQQLVQPEGHQHEQAATQGSQQGIGQVAEQGTQQLVQPEVHQLGQAAAQDSQQGTVQVAEQDTQQSGNQNEKPVVEVQDPGGTTQPLPDINPSSVSQDLLSTHSPPPSNNDNNNLQSPFTDASPPNLPSMQSTDNGPATQASPADDAKYIIIDGTRIPLDFESEATVPSPTMPTSTIAPEGIYGQPTVNTDAVAPSVQSNTQVTGSGVDRTENLVNSQPTSAELNITPTNSPMLTDGQPRTVQSNQFVPSASSPDLVKELEPLTNTIENEEETVKTEESSSIIDKVKNMIISSISSAENEDEDEEDSDAEATQERPESGLPPPVESGHDLSMDLPDNKPQQRSEPVPIGEPPLPNAIIDQQQQQKLEDSGSEPESLQDKSVETNSGADVRPVSDSSSSQVIGDMEKAAEVTPNLQTLSDHGEVSSAVLSETSGATVVSSSQRDVNTPGANLQDNTANNPHKQGDGESEIKTENLGQEPLTVTENPNSSRENKQDSGGTNENVNTVTNNNDNIVKQPEVSQEMKEESSKAIGLDSAVPSKRSEEAATTSDVSKEQIENTHNSETSTSPNQPENPNTSHSSHEEQTAKHHEDIPGVPVGNSNSSDSGANTEKNSEQQDPPPISDTNKVDNAPKQGYVTGPPLNNPNPPPNLNTNEVETAAKPENVADTPLNSSTPSPNPDVNAEETASKEQMVEHHENLTDTPSDTPAVVSSIPSDNPNSSPSTITDQQEKAKASEEIDLSSENNSTNEDNHYEINNDIPSNTLDEKEEESAHQGSIPPQQENSDLPGEQGMLDNVFPTADSSLSSSENPESELNHNDDDVGNSEDERIEDDNSTPLPVPQAMSQPREEDLDESNHANVESTAHNSDMEAEMEERNSDGDEHSEHIADYNHNTNSDTNAEPNGASIRSAEDEEAVDPSEGDPSVYESSEHEGSSSHDDKDYTESIDSAELEQEGSVQVQYMEMLRSYLDTVISLIPDPLYSALEELGMKGMSPRVTIFTAFTGILTLILISTGLFIKRGSQEGFLKGKLCVSEGKLFKVTAENQVIKDELELSRKRVYSLEESLDEAQSALCPLEDQLKSSKSQSSKLYASFQDVKEKMAAQQEAVEALRADLLRKEQEISTECSERQKAEEMVDSLKLKLLQYDAQLSETQEEVSRYTRECSELKDHNAKLVKESDHQMKQAKKLEKRLETAQTQLDLSQKTQKQQEESLSQKDEEIMTLKTALRLVESLKTSLESTEGEVSLGEDNLKQLLEVSEITVKLEKFEEENKKLITQLESEKENSANLQDQYLKAEEMSKSLQESTKIFQQEKIKAVTELEVLTNYFKETEMRMQKELGAQEAWLQQKAENATSSDKKAAESQQQAAQYKSQIKTLKEELESTERSYKNQVAAQEKKAHENWLGARAAERKLEDSKQECAGLRQRLIVLERDMESLKNSSDSIIRPIPKRPGASGNEQLYTEENQLETSSSSLLGSSGKIEESDLAKPRMVPFAPLPMPPMPLPPMPMPPPFPPPLYSSLPPPPFMPPPFGEPFGPPPPEPWKLPPHNFERGRRSPASSKGPPSPPYSSRNASRQSSPPLPPRRMDEMHERSSRTFSPGSSSSSRDCRDGGSPPLDLHPRLFDFPPMPPRGGGGYRGPTHPPPPPYMDRIPPPGMQGPHRDHSTSHLYTDTPPDKRRGGPDMTTSSPRPPRSSTSPERRNNGPATAV